MKVKLFKEEEEKDVKFYLINTPLETVVFSNKRGSMKKINIVKKNRDFSRIIKNNRPIKSNLFVIYLEKNTNDIYKFGISASKKVGNAVTRNRVKRQIKSILDKNTYKNNFNCIIIIKKDIIDKSFDEMSKDLNILINKLNIKEIK